MGPWWRQVHHTPPDVGTPPDGWEFPLLVNRGTTVGQCHVNNTTGTRFVAVKGYSPRSEIDTYFVERRHAKNPTDST